MSLAKQNFATASEEAINQQINTELQASQVYLSMSAWAQHTSVALPGNDFSLLVYNNWLEDVSHGDDIYITEISSNIN